MLIVSDESDETFCRIMMAEDGVFRIDSRLSPFGLSNYESIADDRSVTASTGVLHHGFSSPAGLPPGPPSLPSAGPSSGLTGSAGGAWKPMPSTQPASGMAVTRGQETVADVGRLTANMQVSITDITTTLLHYIRLMAFFPGQPASTRIAEPFW